MNDTEEKKVTGQKAQGTDDHLKLVEIYNEKMTQRQACLLELSRCQKGRRGLHKIKNRTADQEQELDDWVEKVEGLREEIKELAEFIHFSRPVVEPGQDQRGAGNTTTAGGSGSKAVERKTDHKFRMPDAKYLPNFKAQGDQPANLGAYFRDLERVLEDFQIDRVYFTSALTLALPMKPSIHRDYVHNLRQGNPTGTYEEIVEAFEKHFTKVTTIEQQEKEFEDLRQTEKMLVAEYYTCFVELAGGARDDIHSARLRRKFRRYLLPHLQTALVGHYASRIEDIGIQELFERAQQFESAVYCLPDSRPKSKFKVFNCFDCGKEGHRRGDPECKGMKREEKKKEPEDKGAHQTSGKDGGKSWGPRKMAPSPEVSKPWVSRESGKCYLCGKEGHRKWECPGAKN